MCLVGDERSILGRGASGASNIIRVGEVQARNALEEAIHQACAAARIAPRDISRSCVGMAGASRAEISESVRRILSAMVSGEIEVAGDMEIALQAAFARNPGVIVMAGTGSIAYGRNASGRTARAGGWGFAISDEGSGHWIGREALAAIFRALDKDENHADSLLQAFMKAWGVQSKDQLVVAANTSSEFSTLFPAVLEAAQAGNCLARDVLSRAAAELAGLATIVLQKLFDAEQHVPVAMSGGVFSNSALARDVFYNEIRKTHAKVVVGEKIIDPVLGALEKARNPV